MFADSLLDVSWAQRSRRGMSTLTSFGLQAIVLGVVIVLSILKTVVMPAAQTVSTPITLGRLEPRPIPNRPHGDPASPPRPITPTAFHFMQPDHIPIGIHSDPVEPIPELPGGPGDPIGIGIPSNGPGLPIPLPSGTRPVLPTPPAPPVHPIRVSRISEGMLIRRVQPVYPPLARSARVQGSVVLAAVISKAGTIENLRALSGHPMLVPSAIDAVSQWRYRPYILNNEPVEVETEITVNFTLSGN